MEHNFGLMEVSAKLGHGVKEAFNRLVAEVYRSMEIEGLTEVMSDNYGRGRDEVHQGSLILDSQKHFFGGDSAQTSAVRTDENTGKKKRCCK